MKRFVTHINQPSEEGESFPLGSTIFPDGVNFSLFCKNGTGVELLLFDNVSDIEPSKVIPLHPKRNRTYHYWHMFVPGIVNGQLYAYRINGPSEPCNGHRYDAGQVLLDPYSHVVAIPDSYNRYDWVSPVERKSSSMKSVVAD